MTLFILRTGSTLGVTGALFGLKSTSIVTANFVTWLQALAIVLKIQMPFPDQASTQASVPREWIETFGSSRVRIVLDATNININTPQDPEVQSGTYSSYYSGNVLKILLGTSAAGAITFVSLPFPGKITDVVLTEQLLALGLLEEGDDVCVDKGFTIHHLMYLVGIGVLMPPKKKNGFFTLPRPR
jgi:hypothetical protein